MQLCELQMFDGTRERWLSFGDITFWNEMKLCELGINFFCLITCACCCFVRVLDYIVPSVWFFGSIFLT